VSLPFIHPLALRYAVTITYESRPSDDQREYTGAYTISWSGSTGATSYELYEQFNWGSWSLIHNTSAASKAVSGKTPGTWGYTVRACAASGCSAFTGTTTVTVSAPATPGTPSGPSDDYDGAYTISWSGQTGATNYTLQERVNSGGWSTIHSGSATSTAVSGRTAGTWDYQVRAESGAGNSSFSSAKSVVVTLPPSSAPSTPTGPTGTEYTGAYTISWGTVSAATSYRLEEQFNSGGWSEIHNASGVSKAVSGKTPGTWDYRARGCNVAGCGGYSSTKSVTVSAPAAPGTPSGPTGTEYTGAYTISWTAQTGATSYLLHAGNNCFAPNAAFYVKAADSTGATSYQFFDALERPVGSDSPLAGGKRSRERTVYLANGHVDQLSLPYVAGESVHWVDLTYDTLGRTLTEDDEETGTTATYEYLGHELEVTDGTSHTTRYLHNALGQIKQVIDAASGNTFYTYHPFGELHTVTDNDANETEILYDARGFKTDMYDPDMGHWQYDHNAYGELVEQIDAKSQIVDLVYDAAGRLISRDEDEGLTEWDYYPYTATAGYAGKLYQVTSPGGLVETYEYHSTNGQVAEIFREIGSADYELDFSFDTHGRMTQITYPLILLRIPFMAFHSIAECW
jgi:YD repeat-containing protein